MTRVYAILALVVPALLVAALVTSTAAVVLALLFQPERCTELTVLSLLFAVTHLYLERF